MTEVEDRREKAEQLITFLFSVIRFQHLPSVFRLPFSASVQKTDDRGLKTDIEDRREKADNELMAIKSFRDLEVYQESLQLAKEVNDLLKSFPTSEKYILVDQMKRASRGIPSLIAEGWARRELVKEFKKYLRETVGEANEMMNHLEQSRLFGFISEVTARDLIERYDKLAGKLSNLKDNWQNFKKH